MQLSLAAGPGCGGAAGAGQLLPGSAAAAPAACHHLTEPLLCAARLGVRSLLPFPWPQMRGGNRTETRRASGAATETCAPRVRPTPPPDVPASTSDAFPAHMAARAALGGKGSLRQRKSFPRPHGKGSARSQRRAPRCSSAASPAAPRRAAGSSAAPRRPREPRSSPRAGSFNYSCTPAQTACARWAGAIGFQTCAGWEAPASFPACLLLERAGSRLVSSLHCRGGGSCLLPRIVCKCECLTINNAAS